MIAASEHLDRILAALPAPETRVVSLAEAHGVVLAQDVAARFAVPPFDNSAMDGFAVRSADVGGATADAPVRLPVRGDVPAGAGAVVSLEPGTAVRIMTGAPVPSGADAVVPVELTDQPAGPHAGKALAGTVAVREFVAAGRHIRRVGEDVVVGDAVLRAGTRLRARHLSAAASTGHGELEVFPRPRVGVLATGAELVSPGTPLGPGQIPDSNSTLVAGLVREAGAEPILLRTVSDDPAALAELLDTQLASLDALVTTGGVSAGAYDVVKEVLDPTAARHGQFSGHVRFERVAMQPGKPQGFGVLTPPAGGREVPVFTLPGNPVSVFVSFHVFVAPALTRLAGTPAEIGGDEGGAGLRDGVAGASWRAAAGRVQFMPVVTTSDDGVLRVVPAAGGGSGSHLVASLANADALAVVPQDVAEVHEGDAVGVMMVP